MYIENFSVEKGHLYAAYRKENNQMAKVDLGQVIGPAGPKGDTPVKGTDYFTEADKQEIAEQAAGLVSIPNKLPNPNALTFTGAVTGSYDGSAQLNVNIPQGGSWNELKDKPFYLEKTLVIELTKDDFTVNNQSGYIKYMYRSTPKLDWFTPEGSIAFEIKIVDTNGRRYTATQDSLDVHFENDTTDDGYEYWECYSDLVEIISGVDLNLYYDNDEYYYKDEWGILVKHSGIEFSEINIKIYRIDAKKIPEICLDAAIGKTAITVGEVLADSEAEMSPSVIIPDLRIPISPSNFGEDIYFDRISKRLKISGDLFPYNGFINYTFQQVTPTTAGSSISFDMSSEGDTLWDKVGYYSSWRHGGYMFFDLRSTYSDGGRIRFLSCGNSNSSSNGVVAASNLGKLYTVVFNYTNNNKTLNVTLKCVAE